MILKSLVLGLITLANLTSISIHSTWGGLGRPRITVTTITGNNGAFVRSDGNPVPAADVQAFLDALQRTPIDSFDVSRTGYTPKDLIDNLATVEGYLGDAAAIPQVRAAFESGYLDFPSFERHVAEGFSQPCHSGRMLDSYPHLAVAVDGGGEHLTINSDSSNLYMLPLNITSGSGTERDCDPALSRAIAQLLPKDATNRSGLADNANTILNFGYGLAESPRVNELVERYGASPQELEHLAHSMGLDLHYELQRASANWTGELWLANMPQVHLDLPDRSTAAVVRKRLLEKKHLLERVFRDTWFRKALAAHPRVRVYITVGAESGGAVVDDLVHAGQIAAAAALDRGAIAPPLIEVSDSRGLWAHWWLLDNGDMLLGLFEPSHPPFAFSKAWYARIPRVPSIESPGYMISGVVVHPDGQSQVLALSP